MENIFEKLSLGDAVTNSGGGDISVLAAQRNEISELGPYCNSSKCKKIIWLLAQKLLRRRLNLY